MDPETTGTPPAGGSLAEFLRAHKDRLLDAWMRDVRRVVPQADGLTRPELADAAPRLLDRIAELVEAGRSPEHGIRVEAAEAHAVTRLNQGFSLSQVTREYAMLRDRILGEWHSANRAELVRADEVRILNYAMDEGVTAAVSQYAETRGRVMDAIDRVSAAALHSSDMEDLLRKLLQVFLETAPVVDTAAILLRDDDHLTVRATVGLEEEMERHFRIPIGHGFSGEIAATRKPLFTASAAEDERVLSPVIRKKGIRALYGTPLLEGDDLLGVAHMASATAYEFSEQDMQLFRELTRRAASAISLHTLRDRERRKAAELDAVIESIPEGVYLADGSGLARVNTLGARMLGFGNPEELCKAIPQLQERIQTRYADSGERIPTEDEVIVRAMRGESASREVLVRNVRTGLDLYVHSSAAPIRQSGGLVGAVAVNRDITREVRRREGLAFVAAASRGFLRRDLDVRAVFESIATSAVRGFADLCLTFEVDEDGLVRRSQAISSEPGLMPVLDDLRRRPPILPESNHPAATAIRERRTLVTTELDAEVIEGFAEDDAYARLLEQTGARSTICAPLLADDQDRVVGAIALATRAPRPPFDPEDARHLEEALARATLALGIARAHGEARTAVRSRDQMLSVVSHDLRNPLGTIVLNTAILRRTFEADVSMRRYLRHLDGIHRSAERMKRLIEDLLDLGSIEAGRLEVNRQTVNPAELVDEAFAIHAPAAQDLRVSLGREVSSGLPPVSCDRDRIQQVFGNLVGNALKVVRPDTGEIVLGARPVDEGVCFSVTDNGPGIPDEDRERIFELFRRGTRPGYTGVGLGLAIARGIVESHGGRLCLETEPGKGTTFSFMIPRA